MPLPTFTLSQVVWKTTDNTDNFAAGTRTFTPVVMTGKVGNLTWHLQPNTQVILDFGTANQETVLVTAVTANTFTCVTTKAHNGTTTPFGVQGFVDVVWSSAWSTHSPQVGGKAVVVHPVGKANNPLTVRGDMALWDDAAGQFVNVDQSEVGTTICPKL